MLEECNKERFNREIYWIAYYQSHEIDKGYNKTFGGEKGKEKYTEESLEKIRNQPGYWKGKKMSKEHAEKCAKARIGTKRSEETKEKIRQAGLKRGPASEESKRKMSESSTGKVVSEETKLKISYTMLNKLGITEQQLLEIYKRSINGEHQKRLSEEFNIPYKAISFIKTKRIFKIILDKLLKNNKNKKE